MGLLGKKKGSVPDGVPGMAVVTHMGGGLLMQAEADAARAALG
jgi:hypothetical protein